MAGSRFNLRRVEVQAAWALNCALLALLPLGLAAWQLVARYDPEMRGVRYGSRSWLLPGMMACLGAAITLSLVAALLGYSSADHRRNDRPGRSWAGFFVGAAGATIGIIALIAFWLLKIAVV
ncbi:MAG: hypothetical protein FLDDKLPJ_00262 [Phycisphaerae bacterium]|nr:hypothetical protein [Phycisphaerae bacterium]